MSHRSCIIVYSGELSEVKGLSTKLRHDEVFVCVRSGRFAVIDSRVDLSVRIGASSVPQIGFMGLIPDRSLLPGLET
jgi:hypothetical protein